jgi:phosphoribosylglycinamide formyltransferase-1
MRVTVCSSGGGGNLRAVVEGANFGSYQVNQVVVNRDCRAIQVAEEVGIPWVLVDNKSKRFADMFLEAIPSGTHLIVLAGFLPILPPKVIRKWEGKIINTHPSLLPDFGGIGMYGVKVHQAVLSSGAEETGCTVHFVNEIVDGGRVIAQTRTRVLPLETPWQLGSRVFELEGPLLVQAINDLAKIKA